LKFKIDVSKVQNVIYSCESKAEFSASQSSVSHDPSEIILIFGTQETCLKQLCCLIFLWKPWYILINRNFKRTAFI